MKYIVELHYEIVVEAESKDDAENEAICQVDESNLTAVNAREDDAY